MNEQQAREYTEGLGNVLKGSWQLIKNARDLGVPKALGMSTEAWVRDKLGGYTKLPKEERQQAALELKEDGYSTRESAEVLGVDHKTVVNDISGGENSPEIEIKPKENNDVHMDGGENSPAPHVSKNSGENEWYTPPEFIEAARRVMGSIDTDPASSEIANRTVGAATFYTVEDDGLTQPWQGNVWMNPPYAQPLIEEFATALVTRWKDSEISQACVLVNNATDTQWFQRMAKRASFICFIAKRVRFLDPQGLPGAPLQGQAALYFGPSGERFSEEFKAFGTIMKTVRH